MSKRKRLIKYGDLAKGILMYLIAAFVSIVSLAALAGIAVGGMVT